MSSQLCLFHCKLLACRLGMQHEGCARGSRLQYALTLVLLACGARSSSAAATQAAETDAAGLADWNKPHGFGAALK